MDLKCEKHLLIAAGILALFPLSIASADTLNGTGGSWQPASSWTQSQLVVAPGNPTGTLGTPYWNNYSGDGPMGNIGWCLTGGSAVCTMANSPGTTLPYYGTNSGGSVPSMFLMSSGTPLLLSVAGIHTDEIQSTAYDVFGYYLTDANGNPLGGVGGLHPLFSTNPLGSPISVGSTAPLNLKAGSDYGFYIENIKGGGTPFESDYYFYMNTPSNVDGSLTENPALQHFVFFQSSTGYIIGEQDGVGCTNNLACDPPDHFDFNNIIVTEGSIPEPATAGLIGISVFVLGAFIRRAKRN